MTRRYGKIKLAQDDVQSLAAKMVEKHEDRIARGFRLAASSGFWRLKDQSITARFVYRSRNVRPGESFVITETISGIRLE